MESIKRKRVVAPSSTTPKQKNTIPQQAQKIDEVSGQQKKETMKPILDEKFTIDLLTEYFY